MSDVSKFNIMGEDVNVKDSVARNDINMLNNTVNEHIANKYIFIGDSYGDGLTPDGNVPGWCALVPQYMGLSNSDYYSNPLGGIGFTTSPVNFKSKLAECVNHFNNGYVKYIVVCGGANDTDSSVATIEAAIQDFCTYAKANFPNATIMIGCIANCLYPPKKENIMNVAKPAYKNCGQYGAVYLANVEYILHDYSLISRDTLHPTERGYQVLSNKLVNAIKGNLTVFNGLRALKIKELGSGITEVTGLPNVIHTNNIVQMAGGIVYINTVSFTFNGATGLKVCSIEYDNYIVGSQFTYVTSFECAAYVKKSDDTYENCTVLCYFYGNELWIEQRSVTGYGFHNIDNVVNITLFMPSVVLNADYC